MSDMFPDRLRGEKHFKQLPLPLVVEIARVGERNINPHMHDFVELVYVSKGQGKHSISAEDGGQVTSYSISSGDIFLITPDRQHAYHDNTDLVVYNVIFQPVVFGQDAAALRSLPGLLDFLILEPLFREEDHFGNKLHLNTVQARHVQGFLDTIISELTEQPDGFALRMRAVFIEMLVMLGRYFKDMQESDDGRVASGRHRAIEQAVAYMESHFSQELSLEDIALSAYLSPNYFSELFKTHVGVPPWEYLTQLRLEEAGQLLKDSDRSITDIALSVGFSDSSYFSKVFKERHQQTPSQYRKAAQSQSR